MHKTPKKLKRGFKVHAESHNELVEYVKRTRPIPVHGHTETNSGTMPPHPSPSFRAQFTPSFIEHKTAPKLVIYPGYVFGSWRDAGDTAESHLPDAQQWVIEPKIGGSYLTAEEQPQLSLTAGQKNYIYLHIPAGMINLNDDGQLASHAAPQADAMRWFLEGPVWANRPPVYRSGITSTDRDPDEPIPPVQPATYVYPGAETDN